jgi:hypothetical protein
MLLINTKRGQNKYPLLVKGVDTEEDGMEKRRG